MVCAGKHLRRSARRARDGRPGRERRSSAVRASEAHRGPVAAGNGADGARERDGRYRGGGPIRRSSGEWWEGSERPLDSNVRTRKSRSWPVQSCERSVCDEDRNPVLGGLIEDGRAMLTVFTTHCARWATPRGGAAEAETARFAINTSFAALRGARTRPAGPDVSFEGADASPFPPFAGGPANRAPNPSSPVARTRAVRPIAARRGPVVLGALVPQMVTQTRWCRRWPSEIGGAADGPPGPGCFRHRSRAVSPSARVLTRAEPALSHGRVRRAFLPIGAERQAIRMRDSVLPEHIVAGPHVHVDAEPRVRFDGPLQWRLIG